MITFWGNFGWASVTRHPSDLTISNASSEIATKLDVIWAASQTVPYSLYSWILMTRLFRTGGIRLLIASQLYLVSNVYWKHKYSYTMSSCPTCPFLVIVASYLATQNHNNTRPLKRTHHFHDVDRLPVYRALGKSSALYRVPFWDANCICLVSGSQGQKNHYSVKSKRKETALTSPHQRNTLRSLIYVDFISTN